MKHPTWLAFLLVVSLILPLTPSPVAAQTPAVADTALDAPLDAQTPTLLGDGKYEVRWFFTATGSASGGDQYKTWTAYRNVVIQGSAIVNDPPGDYATVEPFQLTVTDNSQVVENGNCYQDVTREFITDPSLYSGKPDEFWAFFGSHMAPQREDGSWYMKDPFFHDFWSSGEIARDFPYKYVFDHKDLCHPDSNRHSESTYELASYFDWYYTDDHGSDIPFEGDQDGVVFRKNITYIKDYNIVSGYLVPLQVNFSATVRRIGGCADRRGSIDATDPIVKDVNLRVQVDHRTIPPNAGDTLQPPDPATLTLLATCEGVPVRNVTLKVAVDALANSGGHQHTNGANPRPRGFLDGPQNKDYVEITRKVPSITVTTDDQGRAIIRFLPGRDYDSGNRGGRCAGDQRGVAGDYKIDLETTKPAQFAGKKLDTTIIVARTDFVPLPTGNNYYKKYNSTVHPDGTSGKAPTMQVLQRLADDFNAAQVAHNAALAQANKPAWPIVELAIIDISLPGGGLFDTGGTNVCADGQPRVGFIPWQIPHQTHMTGKGIDISTSVWWSNATPTRFKWYRNTLRALGCNYGTWAKEGAFHLEADQNSANWGSFHAGCTYTPDTLTAAEADAGSPTFVTVPYAGADVFVSLLPDTTDDEVMLAAPGEVVTYTVGVSNLLGDAPANGVQVTATLPAGLTFVAADPVPTRFDAPNQPVWVVGNLAAGAFPESFDFSVQVDAGVAPDTALILAAAATTTSSEAIVENNHEGDALIVRAPGPDLVAESDLEAVALTADDPITVTLNVANQGSDPAANASLDFTLPDGVVLMNSAPLTPTQAANVLTWQFGTLPVDAAQALTLTLDLSGAATAPFDPMLGTSTPVTFTWQANTTADIDPDNNGGTVVGALTLSGYDALVILDVNGPTPGTLTVGQTVTYTLNYANLGNQVAAGAELSLRLGTGLRLLDAQPPAGQPVDGALPWALGDLAVGATGYITVHAQVDSIPSEGSLTVAKISADGFDIAPVNDIAYDERQAALAASGGTQYFFMPLLER